MQMVKNNIKLSIKAYYVVLLNRFYTVRKQNTNNLNMFTRIHLFTYKKIYQIKS